MLLKSHRLLVVALVALSCVGCDVYDDSLLPDDGLNSIPPRPDPSYEAESIEPLTIALRDPVLDQERDDRWRQIGFDLDGLQTETRDSEVECLPASTDPDNPDDVLTPLDGENGIDNAVGGQLLPLVGLSPSVKSLPEDARSSHEAGQGTLIVYITDYNGLRYDPRVQVLVAQAVAGTFLPASEVAFVDGELVEIESGDPAPSPAWEGGDHWYVRDDAFKSPDLEQPRISDQNAYVSNGKLVLHLRESASILFFAGEATVTVRLSQGVVLAELEEDLSGVSRVNIGGRMSLDDVLETGASAGVCEGTEVRELIETAVVGMADVLAEPGTAGGRSAICDAVSVGVLFEGGVRGVGTPTLVESPPVSNPCETL